MKRDRCTMSTAARPTSASRPPCWWPVETTLPSGSLRLFTSNRSAANQFRYESYQSGKVINNHVTFSHALIPSTSWRRDRFSLKRASSASTQPQNTGARTAHSSSPSLWSEMLTAMGKDTPDHPLPVGALKKGRSHFDSSQPP